ncbi:MAG: hypothetical protein ACREXS_00225 [Gammaproteobacteria bacterium]
MGEIGMLIPVLVGLIGLALYRVGAFTDDELDGIEGKREELSGRIHERYEIGNEEAVPQPRLLESLPDDMRFEITPADRPYLTEAGRKALERSGDNILVIGEVKKIENELQAERQSNEPTPTLYYLALKPG